MPDDEKERQIELVAKELDIEIPIVPPEEYAPVSWEQAREMDANKLKVESHTVTHPILINISEEQLNFELKQSKNRLEEQLGRRMEVFCYPNGAVNEAVWQADEENGYECAVTTRQGFNSNGVNPFLMKRIDAQKDIIDFAQSVSGFEDFKQRLRN
jgi:peptidoglycan/xylan/chitin deacetylase (PgdA/CDA1 family)